MPSTPEKNPLEVHRVRGCAGCAGEGCSMAEMGRLRSARGERTLLSHCISTASLSRCCTKSVCMDPDASLLPCRKQQCPRGHCTGSGVARPSAQLLVPAESKAPGQATRSSDTSCNWNCFSGLALNPRSQSPWTGGGEQITVFNSSILPV